MSYKKYMEKYNTTLTTERRNVEFLHSVGRTIVEAFELGFDLIVEETIKSGDFSKELENFLKEYQERKTTAIEKMAYLAELKTKMVDQMIQQRHQKEQRAKESQIRVWDKGIDRYAIIAISDYDPKWHILDSPMASIEEHGAGPTTTTNPHPGTPTE